MKIMLLAISISVLGMAGCNNNNSGASISFQPEESKSDKKEATTTTAATIPLTDITASKDVKTLLAQSWENKDDAQEAALSGGGGAFEMPYRGFSFFADGSVVQNPRDDIRFGKWSIDDAGKQVTITYANGTKAQYTIVKIEAKDMVLANMADKKNIEYRAEGKVQKNITDNPFYGANNQWRVKPAKPETDEAIKDRLHQALVFYTKFLDYNIAIGGKTVTFSGIPSIFVWYGGGVSVTPPAKTEQKWINCFYNKEQALKAQAMVENIIGKKYKWDKDEPNWVKQDADGVRQIADTLAATPMNVLIK